jgi:hypothetical protein
LANFCRDYRLDRIVVTAESLQEAATYERIYGKEEGDIIISGRFYKIRTPLIWACQTRMGIINSRKKLS